MIQRSTNRVATRPTRWVRASAARAQQSSRIAAPFVLAGSFLLFLLQACGGRVSDESRASRGALTGMQQRVVGFEAPTTDWTASSGTRGASTRHTEGNLSLSLSGIGYADIVSVPLSSLGNVADTVSYKLLLPANQPNPWWYGETKLHIDIPSLGINNAFIGQRNLTGLPLDTFNTITYTLPPDVAAAMRGSYTEDLRFKIVLNVPQSNEEYLLDELDVGLGEPPPDAGTGTGGSGGSGPDAGAGTGGSAGTGPDGGGPTELELALKYPPGIDPSTLFFVAYDVLDVGNGADINADVANTGTGSTRIGVAAEVQGIHSNAQVELLDQAVVGGFIRTAAPVIEHAGVSVGGSISENAPFEPLDARTLTVSVPESSQGELVVAPGGTRSAAPGRYDAVIAGAGASLLFSTGQYVCDSLVLEPGSRIVVDEQAGPVEVYVLGDVTLRGTVVTSGAGATSSILGTFTTGTVHVEAALGATLVAPEAEVVIHPVATPHAGAAFARVLRIEANTDVEAFPSSVVTGPCGVCPHPENPCLRTYCGTWLVRCMVEGADGRACNDGDPGTTGEICVRGSCQQAVPDPQDDTGYILRLVEYGEIPRHAEGRAAQFQEALREAGGGGDKAAVVSMTIADPIVIPVVVHVLESVAQEEPTNEQIVAAINNLNKRFASVDLATIRPVFRPVAGTSHLRFQLAKRMPECGTNWDWNVNREVTPGIHRVAVIGDGDYDVGLVVPEYPNPNTNGVLPWDADQYLNLYAAELHAFGDEHPGGRSVPIVDDVGTNYASVAVRHVEWTDPASGALAHEVGHYFGLEHVDWDEDDFPCEEQGPTDETCATFGDLVCDTPASTGDFSGCAPANSCVDSLPMSYGTAAPDPTDMYENYMNRLIGGCEAMFSFGQAALMESWFAVGQGTNAWHPAALTASAALSPPPQVAGQPDLWIKDGEDDDGEIPYAGEFPHRSSDIWVRRSRADDGGETIFVHENPLGGQENTVYVRVMNRSCETAMEDETPVHLYWAKAATELSWSSPWKGQQITVEVIDENGETQEVEMALGGEIGELAVSALGPGESEVVPFTWDVPHPSDFEGINADQSHYCLLAIVGDEPSEPQDLADMVRGSNDIAWKNVTVVSELDDYIAYVSVGGTSNEEYGQRLVFEVPELQEGQPTVFEWAIVTVDLGPLWDEWSAKNDIQEEDNIELGSGTEVTLRGDGATIRGLSLEDTQFFTIAIRFDPLGDTAAERELMDVYALNVTQYRETDPLDEVGGQYIQVKTQVPITQVYP